MKFRSTVRSRRKPAARAGVPAVAALALFEAWRRRRKLAALASRVLATRRRSPV